MSAINNGGQAFPCMPPQDTGAGSAVGYPFPDSGMTLRDYFAAKAMAAILAGRNMDKNGFLHCDVADDDYAYADAMLDSRERYYRSGKSSEKVGDDGWIKWKGGECPIPDGVLFKFRFRDGEEYKAYDNASKWCWEHRGIDGDIIAYRVLKGGAA